MSVKEQLITAIRFNNNELLKKTILAINDSNKKHYIESIYNINKTKTTLLGHAIINESDKLVKTLIQNGANPFYFDVNTKTPTRTILTLKCVEKNLPFADYILKNNQHNHILNTPFENLYQTNSNITLLEILFEGAVRFLNTKIITILLPYIQKLDNTSEQFNRLQYLFNTSCDIQRSFFYEQYGNNPNISLYRKSIKVSNLLLDEILANKEDRDLEKELISTVGTINLKMFNHFIKNTTIKHFNTDEAICNILTRDKTDIFKNHKYTTKKIESMIVSITSMTNPIHFQKKSISLFTNNIINSDKLTLFTLFENKIKPHLTQSDHDHYIEQITAISIVENNQTIISQIDKQNYFNDARIYNAVQYFLEQIQFSNGTIIPNKTNTTILKKIDEIYVLSTHLANKNTIQIDKTTFLTTALSQFITKCKIYHDYNKYVVISTEIIKIILAHSELYLTIDNIKKLVLLTEASKLNEIHSIFLRDLLMHEHTQQLTLTKSINKRI